MFTPGAVDFFLTVGLTVDSSPHRDFFAETCQTSPMSGAQSVFREKSCNLEVHGRYDL